MSRTIEAIKKEMTNYFIQNEVIQSKYSLDLSKTFDEQFSKTGLENIIFNVVAACIWTLEKLFDRHKQEVSELINALKPHSLRWYATKAKAFQLGRILITDTDQYDNASVSDEQIKKEQIITYAAVEQKASISYVKVATGGMGERQQITKNQEIALTAYMEEVKDAGVTLVIVNQIADEFNISIDVYYNPQVFDDTLDRLDGGGKIVHETIATVVENLPFNGEYRNSDLIKILTELEGVEYVELNSSSSNGQIINAKYVPISGYFRVDKTKLGIKPIAYENI